MAFMIGGATVGATVFGLVGPSPAPPVSGLATWRISADLRAAAARRDSVN